MLGTFREVVVDTEFTASGPKIAVSEMLSKSENYALIKKGSNGGSPEATARCSILLQISHGRQVELAGRDESGAAPRRAEPSRIDRGEVAREPCRVVAREGVQNHLRLCVGAEG